MLEDRNKKAAHLGEGTWFNKTTRKECQTDVTFYPTTKLWITENGQRREISKPQLEREYFPLEI